MNDSVLWRELMENYIIVTDSTCDLPIEYTQANNVKILWLSCILDGETYGADKYLEPSVLYEKIRKGAMPSTSQVNPDEAKKVFDELLKEYSAILYIGFSSGLSGTYQSAVIAKNEILDENPDAKIYTIDSLCASLGEGLLVNKAVENKNNGMSIEDNYKSIENQKLNLCHLFTVDDLFHLQRGGRVSKTTAIVGTVVGIKPLLHVDNEGKLVSVGKCRGRKKSLTWLVDTMESKMGSFKDKNKCVFISHGDCYEEAAFVADEIKNRFGIEDILINYCGAVIGSHSGPGTMAVFFFADER